MKKFYCVTSSVDDYGRCTAAITAECEADTKPESKFRLFLCVPGQDNFVWLSTR